MLPRGAPVLCTTATANDRVVHDIAQQLGDGLTIRPWPLDRESLELAAVEAARAGAAPRLARSGAPYVARLRDHLLPDGRRHKERRAWLRSLGIEAVPYGGESEHEDRIVFEEALRAAP